LTPYRADALTLTTVASGQLSVVRTKGPTTGNRTQAKNSYPNPIQLATSH